MIKRIEKYGEDNALTGVTKSNHYILNSGHEKFFFDKLGWLHDRYESLYEELLKRGFNVNKELFDDISTTFVIELIDTPYWNKWNPTPEDQYLNMSRLVKRSNLQSVYEELNDGLI